MRTKLILISAALLVLSACKKEEAPPGSILIKVRDTLGNPVPNALVEVYEFTGTLAAPQYTVTQAETTNVKGECTVCNNPSATDMVVNAEGFYNNNFSIGSINFPSDVPEYTISLNAYATMEFILPEGLLEEGHYLDIENLPADVDYENINTEPFSVSGRAFGANQALGIRYKIGQGNQIFADIDSIVRVAPYEHFVFTFTY